MDLRARLAEPGAGRARRVTGEHDRLTTLFLEACELPEEERGVWLDAACEGNSELRRELESLLAHHEDGFFPDAPPSDPVLDTGAILAGRFRIVAPIARGGMGAVYRADDLTLGIPVALKLLLRTNPETRERLLAEVRLARSVAHPTVCRVYDVGEADGCTFLSMEFIDGEDLQKLLRRVRRVPSDRVIELGLALCEGLAAAHDAGVLHRDLKPANVMIDDDGRPRITDFGIATHRGDARERVAVGTPAYMAPEQITGTAPISERTDVYQLGCLLYQLVTGHLLFDEADVEGTIEAQRTRAPVPPSQWQPDVDRRLESAILKALAKEPAERPASMHGFAKLLSTGDEALAPRAAPRREQRPVSILALRWRGLDRLVESVEPEDAREIVESQRALAIAAIEEYGGTVVERSTDGVLALFGAIEAREDEAERSVRAALQLVAHREANAAPLEVTACVHWGPVTLDGQGAPGSGFQPTTVAAERMLHRAEPGAVLLTSAARPLVEAHFDTELVVGAGGGESSANEAVYRVVGERDASDPIRRVRTELIGRDRELDLLCERFDRVAEGYGQFVPISGEAGIGKSRLVAELRRRLVVHDHEWLALRCEPMAQATAFAPVIRLLAESLELGALDEPAARLERVASALRTQGLPASERLPLYASLLSLPLPDDAEPLRPVPEVERRELLDSLREWVLALAAEKPLVVCIEDLQWCDPSSLELLVDLVARIPGERVLLIATHRNEFSASAHWPVASHSTPVVLQRLRNAEAIELVRALAPELETAAAADLAGRCDGVPLFAEELANAVASEATGSASLVPGTLQATLVARLDRVGEAKPLALRAAVLGREFRYSEIVAIAGLGEDELAARLDALVSAEILFRRGTPPHATYSFKHALVHEAAHESLLASDRRALHADAAVVLEASGAAKAELLAHHYEQAGLIEQALVQRRAAAEEAERRSAFAEAATHLERALELAAGLPESEALQFELLCASGSVWEMLHGLGSARSLSCYERADALSEVIEAPRLQIARLRYLRVNALFESEQPQSYAEALARLVQLAQETDDPETSTLVATGLGAKPLLADGNPAEAVRIFSDAQRAAAQSRPGALAEILHEDVVGVPLVLGSIAQALAGDPDAARRWADRGAGSAREGGRPYPLAFALACGAKTCLLLRDFDATVAAATECLEVSERFGFEMPAGIAQAALGLCALEANPNADPKRVEEGIDRIRRAGTRHLVSAFWAEQAEMLISSDPAAARRSLDEARRASNPQLDAWYDPELERLEALLGARGGATESSIEGAFTGSLELARERGAVAFELRTARSYASWLDSRARTDDARSVLATTLGTEPLASCKAPWRDLEQARQLARRLAADSPG